MTMSQELTILVGIPASGKTTWAHRNNENAVVLSSDGVRADMGIDEYSPEMNERVFAEFHRQLAEKIRSGRNVILDATNLRREYRFAARTVAREAVIAGFALRERCILFPVGKAFERNRERTERFRVPDEVMKSMWSSYCRSYAEVWNEGFDDVLEYTGEESLLRRRAAVHVNGKEADATRRYALLILPSGFPFGEHEELLRNAGMFVRSTWMDGTGTKTIIFEKKEGE